MSAPHLCALRDLATRALSTCRPPLFLVGGPGSGKGAVSNYLSQTRGCDHFSVGDLLRCEARSDPHLRAKLDAGHVVPALVSATIALRRLLLANGLAVVDGFPRDERAAALWEQLRAPCGAALFLDCSPSLLRKRLLARGRSDDDASVIETRLQFHLRETPRLWRFYEQRGLAFRVNGQGTIDDVCARIDEALDSPPLDLLLAPPVHV